MKEGKIIKLLSSFLKERILTDKAELLPYTFDSTPDTKGVLPLAVVFPVSTEEVKKVVEICIEYKIPIYPRGAGTSVSGGPIPTKRGIVLSLQKMNKLLEIDPDNMTALVEPGVIVAELDKKVSKFGLMYPPDPGSVNVATIGGTIAENAGGLRGLKYGVTKDYVLGLEVVLPTGEVFSFGGKCVKNVTGYNFSGIFVGSEGTIGIITKALLKLLPLPKYKKTIMAIFDKLEKAGEVVRNIIRSHIIPASMEILDNFTIKAVENFAKIGLPTQAQAILLIEVDAMGKDQVEEESQIIAGIIKKVNGKVEIAKNEEERQKLWQARRAAFPALAHLKPIIFIEDIAVPRTNLVEMFKSIQSISQKYNLPIATVGHAGDGNIHPMILLDSEKEIEIVDKALNEIIEKAISLGGTITGEHGIGISKKKYLKKQIHKVGITVMRQIKKSFDPYLILNPEKLLI